jgi:hypothetical protein
MKRYISIFKESGTGNYAPSSILFKTDEEFNRAVELLSSLNFQFKPDFYIRKNGNISGYSKNYLSFTYSKDWTKLVKLLQKNNVDFKQIK